MNPNNLNLDFKMEDLKKKFMLKAIKIAEDNVVNQKGGPFGAVVVKDGKIIGEGANRVTSSNDPTAHAEVNAIRDACKNINSFILYDCEIYSSCEPCPMCLSAIYWSKIDKIYYAATQSDAKNAGFNDSIIYEELKLDWKKRKIISGNFHRNNAKEIFKLWINDENKIEY